PLLVAAVGGAEGVVAHEADAREAAGQLLLEDREDLVAPEEIVPELADGLALERRQARGDVGRLHRAGPARPHYPVDLASFGSAHASTSNTDGRESGGGVRGRSRSSA